MKILTCLFILISLCCSSALAQDEIKLQRDDISVPTDFANALKRANLYFTMPEGYTKTKVIANNDMDYIYAIRSANKKIEVRYVIWPLDSQLAEYNRPRDSGETRLDPNTIYKTTTFMHMANISSQPFDQLQEVLSFDSAAVMNEFNADWGGTASVELRKSFGGKNKWCAVVGLHKDKVADAWCFFLAKTKEDLLGEWENAFHSIRFK